MFKLYSAMATASVIIRQFFLPNPFEPLTDTVVITLSGNVFSVPPIVLNWLAEPLLHVVAFTITGVYYTRGMSNPATGSFLYLFFYAFHVGILYLLSIFKFATVAIVIVIVLYVLLHVGVFAIRNRFNSRF